MPALKYPSLAVGGVGIQRVQSDGNTGPIGLSNLTTKNLIILKSVMFFLKNKTIKKNLYFSQSTTSELGSQSGWGNESALPYRIGHNVMGSPASGRAGWFSTVGLGRGGSSRAAGLEKSETHIFVLIGKEVRGEQVLGETEKSEGPVGAVGERAGECC